MHLNFCNTKLLRIADLLNFCRFYFCGSWVCGCVHDVVCLSYLSLLLFVQPLDILARHCDGLGLVLTLEFCVCAYVW